MTACWSVLTPATVCRLLVVVVTCAAVAVASCCAACALAPSPVERPMTACSIVPAEVVPGVVQSVAMRCALLPLEAPPGVRVSTSPATGEPDMGNCQYCPDAAPGG